MSTTGPALPIHSLTEARLYLRVTPCGACGGGPLIADPQATGHEPDTLKVAVTCKACGRRCDFRFDTRELPARESVTVGVDELLASADGLSPGDAPTPPPINPTDEPSRIIDVAGWLTLYTVIADAARTAGDADPATPADPATTRRLLIQAAQCLDEALKFFDPDNDLPPEDAFFRRHSRQRFRDRPELFTRQRLIDLRRQLPA